MKKRDFMTTAIFRCVISFHNGTRKIVRMAIDGVARFAYMFREQQHNVFANESLLFDISCGERIIMASVAGAKFINERTGEEFLSL